MNATSKYIYFLTLSLRTGGAERQISELYKELPIEKIICLEKGNVYDVPEEKIITLSKHNATTSSLLKYFFIPIYLFRLKKAIKPDKNVVIISFLERANLLNAICKFFFKTISIQSIRTNYSHYCTQKKIPGLLKKIIIASYKYADVVIGNSYGNTLDLIQNFGIKESKTRVINNFYNVEEIRRFSNERLGQPFEDIFATYKCISYASRLDNKKGHFHLIRVLAALKEQNYFVKLFFLGEGSMKQQLIQLCELLKLSFFDSDTHKQASENADVYFMGFQRNPYKFIAKSTIFTFPSFFEGLPNALIEAIICNTICIAADCPSGPREIMTNDTSLSKVASIPELTDFGYLMPPFSGEVILNDSPLNPIELMWKDYILKICKNDISITIDNSEFIKRFEKNMIIKNWENLLQKYTKS